MKLKVSRHNNIVIIRYNAMDPKELTNHHYVMWLNPGIETEPT